jgi:hypothetical protein
MNTTDGRGQLARFGLPLDRLYPEHVIKCHSTETSPFLLKLVSLDLIFLHPSRKKYNALLEIR